MANNLSSAVCGAENSVFDRADDEEDDEDDEDAVGRETFAIPISDLAEVLVLLIPEDEPKGGLERDDGADEAVDRSAVLGGTGAANARPWTATAAAGAAAVPTGFEDVDEETGPCLEEITIAAAG